MTDHGFKTFGERLRGLCDACGRKPPGESGMAIWWETLKDLPDWDAAEALAKWGREQSKPPAPADIWKLACDHGTDRREQKWTEQKREEAKPWVGATELGRAALDELRALPKTLRPPGSWWAYKILDRVADGEQLPYHSIQLACEVAGVDPRYITGLRQDDDQREVAA